MSLNMLYEKIASLPPSLLPMVEQFIDTLPLEKKQDLAAWEGSYEDPDWGPPPVDKNGKRIHPQPGCMKGTFIMHDNFFEPDDDWKEYM